MLCSANPGLDSDAHTRFVPCFQHCTRDKHHGPFLSRRAPTQLNLRPLPSEKRCGRLQSLCSKVLPQRSLLAPRFQSVSCIQVRAPALSVLVDLPICQMRACCIPATNLPAVTNLPAQGAGKKWPLGICTSWCRRNPVRRQPISQVKLCRLQLVPGLGAPVFSASLTVAFDVGRQGGCKPKALICGLC